MYFAPKPFVLLLAWLCVCGSPRAQTPEVITLGEALRLAQERSVMIQSAELDEAAQAAEVSAARGAFFPEVSAFVRPSQRYGLAFDQTTGELGSETSQAMSLGVDASVTLFNGFRTTATLAQARARREAAGLSAARVRQEAAAEVASQFLQVLLDATLVTIRAEALEAQREEQTQVADLAGAGLRPEADVTAQRALVAEAELALLEAEQTSALSQSRLVRLLHLDPLGTYAFTAPDLDAAPSMPSALPVLLTRALEQRADLQAQARRIDAAEAGVRGARGGRLPTITLFASTSSSYTSFSSQVVLGPDGNPVVNDPGTPVLTEDGIPIFVDGEPFIVGTSLAQETTPFGTQLTDNRGGSIGLSIRVPILDQATTRRQVQQAQIDAERARLAMAIQRQDIAIEVREALIAYEAAEKRLDVTAIQLEAAEDALTAAQDRYTNGAATLAELSQARARFVQAQSDRARARYTFAFQGFVLARATGDPLPIR